MAVDAPVTPGRWIGIGWGIVRQDLGNFLLMTVIAVAISLVGNVIVAGPLLAGLFFAVRRQIQEGRTDLADVFYGFNQFVDSLLIGLILTVFGLVGLSLCFFPVFIVAALYLFPFLFLIDRKLPFWDAMEASRKLVWKDPGAYLWFAILLTLLNLLGLILAVVGLLFTIPATIAAITVAYQETVGFVHKPPDNHRPIIIP
jgi:uncharacterized membrane protein